MGSAAASMAAWTCVRVSGRSVRVVPSSSANSCDGVVGCAGAELAHAVSTGSMGEVVRVTIAWSATTSSLAM